MQTISLDYFEPINERFPDMLYLRVDERVCSTRYLVIDKKKNKTMLIDSGDGKDELDFVPDAVFLTHGHWDHTSGVRENWPEVWIHPAERKTHERIIIPPSAKPLLGQTFDFGPFHFNILHTPGHTPGSMCLFEERSGFLFCGDTKFAGGGYGRTDVGGDEGQMEKALKYWSMCHTEFSAPDMGRWKKERNENGVIGARQKALLIMKSPSYITRSSYAIHAKKTSFAKKRAFDKKYPRVNRHKGDIERHCAYY